MWRFLSAVSAMVALAICTDSHAEEATVPVHRISIDGIGEVVGAITFTDQHGGLVLNPDLSNLSPGKHAAHIHENPDCGAGIKDGKKIAGLKAGGHFDPIGHTNHNMSGGHSHAMKPHGDLPEFTADAYGQIRMPISTDKLSLAKVRGRAIMIHRYGENDQNGAKGGGPRIACGIIPR